MHHHHDKQIDTLPILSFSLQTDGAEESIIPLGYKRNPSTSASILYSKEARALKSLHARAHTHSLLSKY